MPLIYKPNENLFDSKAEALVNTVNCVGVMGKGLALEFSERFVASSSRYRIACQHGDIKPGRPFVTAAYHPNHTYIVHVPTKDHWRCPSELPWIEDACSGLRSFILARCVKSIAVPKLGCSNGGLLWSDVNPIIKAWLGDLYETNVEVYGEEIPG